MGLINDNAHEDMTPNSGLVISYTDQVNAAVREGTYTGPLTSICPECGTDFSTMSAARRDEDHMIITSASETPAVIVACEGYFVVNPNLIGFDMPNWTPPLIDPDGDDGYQR